MRQTTRGMTFVPVWSVDRQALGIHIVTPTEIVGDEVRVGYEQTYRETGITITTISRSST